MSSSCDQTIIRIWVSQIKMFASLRLLKLVWMKGGCKLFLPLVVWRGQFWHVPPNQHWHRCSDFQRNLSHVSLFCTNQIQAYMSWKINWHEQTFICNTVDLPLFQTWYLTMQKIQQIRTTRKGAQWSISSFCLTKYWQSFEIQTTNFRMK